MATIGRLNIGVTLASQEFLASQRRIEAGMRSMASTAQRQSAQMQTAFAATTRAVGVLRTAAAGLGLGIASIGFSSMVRGALEAGDALSKTSRQLGLSIEALQGYQRGADLAGVSSEKFRTAMERFNRGLGEAERGTGELKRVLDAAGISIRDQEGNLRTTSAVLEDFADLIARTEGATTRAAQANDAFGRGGQAMLEFLRGGSAGLQQMEEDLRDSIHVTTEQGEAIERFNDRLTTVSQTFETQWTVALGNAIIVGERWSANLDGWAMKLRAFLGITEEQAAEWGKGWLPAAQELSEFDKMLNELAANTGPATRMVEDQTSATEGLAAASGKAAAKVAELTAQQRRLAEAGKILKQTSAGEERALKREEERVKHLEAQLGALQAINAEEMQRRTGQLSAGGLSAPGLPVVADEIDKVSQTYENFLTSLQSSTASTFETIYSGGVTSFGDLFDEALRLATQFASQLTALAIFEPSQFAKFFGGTGGADFFSQLTTGRGAAGTDFAPGFSGVGSSLAGAAGGFAVGTGVGTAIGGSQQNAMIGSAIGTAAGAAIGTFLLPGLGTMGGAMIGGALGGLAGGLFGGGSDDKSKGTISGGLGQISGSGKNLGELTSALQQFDQQISSLLNARQREAVDASLRNFSRFISVKGGISQSDIANATSQRAQAAGRGLGFSNTQTAQDIGTALGTQRAIEDLTGAVTAFERQTEELESQFETLEANAKRFGISLSGLAEAQTKAAADLQKAQDAAISSLLDPFRALLAPLEALQTRLDFQGLNPAEQFARAQTDFQRIAAEASGGSIPAIQQFEAAADLFTQLAGQVGASPGQAAAVSQVQAALTDVRGEIAESQRDASDGITDAIDRARREEIDTLQELIAEVRALGRKLAGNKI